MPSTLKAQIMTTYRCCKLYIIKMLWVSWQVTDTAIKPLSRICFTMLNDCVGLGHQVKANGSGHRSKILTRFHLWLQRAQFHMAILSCTKVTGHYATYRGKPFGAMKFDDLFPASTTLEGGIPNISMMQAIWSASSSPANSGRPVRSSDRIHPRLHMSIATP